jgi:hypothetical protein
MKRKCLLLTAVATLGLTVASVAQTVPNYVPTNGLVGWWPFNGNANDESGNGNNGTVNGATLTEDRFGNINSSYYFNGAISHIILNQSLGNFGQSDFTISVWTLDTSLVNAGALVSKRNAPGYGNFFTIGWGNSPSFEINESNSSNYFASVLPGTFTNIWHYYTFVRDSLSLSIYLDGLLQSQTSSSTIQNINNMENTIFGARYANTSLTQFFKGKIDDIGIWNRALTNCEILDLYNSQLGSFSNAAVTVNPTNAAIGSNATLTVTSPVSSLQWQSNPSNVGWVNISNNTQYNGVTNDTLVVSNLQLSNHNQPFRVLACGDTSNVATIQIADTCITNVTIYDTLLTTVTDTLIINTTLSLPAPNNENTILIYPNPASDHITIDNGNYVAMTGYTIKIENNAGQQVFQSAVNQPQFYIDLSTWSGNGLYFVHLIDPQNNTVTVRKIVLQ